MMRISSRQRESVCSTISLQSTLLWWCSDALMGSPEIAAEVALPPFVCSYVCWQLYQMVGIQYVREGRNGGLWENIQRPGWGQQGKDRLINPLVAAGLSASHPALTIKWNCWDKETSAGGQARKHLQAFSTEVRTWDRESLSGGLGLVWAKGHLEVSGSWFAASVQITDGCPGWERPFQFYRQHFPSHWPFAAPLPPINCFGCGLWWLLSFVCLDIGSWHRKWMCRSSVQL